MGAAENTGCSPDWEEQLRARGYRLTPQRRAVLEAVEELRHATPDQVYAHLQDTGINLSTVYRTLELLDDLELIHHAHLSERAPTYHAAGSHTHSHLVCRGCQQMFSVDEAAMAAALAAVVEPLGFAPDYGHLSIFGLCRLCREEAASNVR